MTETNKTAELQKEARQLRRQIKVTTQGTNKYHQLVNRLIAVNCQRGNL